MRTITLRTEEEFFKYLSDLSKKLGRPKSQIIKEAVLKYGEEIKKEKIHRKMEYLSKKLAEDKEYLKEIKEFEELSGDFVE